MRLRHDIGRLCNRDGQHAIVERSVDTVAIDLERQRDRAGETAKGALDNLQILFLAIIFGLLFALDHQRAAGDLDVQIIDIDTRQFGHHLHRLVGFDDIHRRVKCEFPPIRVTMA